MPLTVAEGAMLGAGMLFAGGATMAYKAKQTRLFKTLYFLSWPTVRTREGSSTKGKGAARRRKGCRCGQPTACHLGVLGADRPCVISLGSQLGSALLWTLMPTEKQMEQVRCLAVLAGMTGLLVAGVLAGLPRPPPLRYNIILLSTYLSDPRPELKDSGFTQQQLDARRAATAAQLQQLKAAAEEGKRRHG